MQSINTYAAEYYVEPSITSSLKLDDNVRLTALPHNTVGAGVIEGKADFAYITEQTNLKLTPAAKVSRYTEEVGLDENDLFVDVTADHFLSSKAQLSLDASMKDEAIGTQEVNVAGTSFDEIRKETKSYGPSISYVVNDKLNLQLSYAFQEVAYDNTSSTRLNSFDYSQFTLTSSYRLNEKNDISLQAYRTVFEVVSSDSETTSHAFQFSFNHFYSDTLSFSAGAGIILSESEFNTFTLAGLTRAEENVSGSLFDFSINKSFETMNVALAFRREVSPGTTGDQDVRDNWLLNVRKKFSNRFNATLNLNYFNNTSQNQFSNTSNDFEFLLLNSSISYLINRNFSVELGYKYSKIDNLNALTTPDSNNVFINLRYDFDKLSISR